MRQATDIRRLVQLILETSEGHTIDFDRHTVEQKKNKRETDRQTQWEREKKKTTPNWRRTQYDY